jgi:putative transposase
MPFRITPLITGYCYHIVNRGNNSKTIFKVKSDYQRVLQVIDYYRSTSTNIRFSDYLKLSTKGQQIFKSKLQTQPPLVQILCFCLMPNHIHLLIKQLQDGGISLFMSRWQNSYARYFNTKHGKKGHLFESSFKAKLIEDDNILWHISRYIHLNPYSAGLIDFDKIQSYPWSSIVDYLSVKTTPFVDTNMIGGHFKDKATYWKFLSNRASYQKKLHYLKHLILE